MAFLTHCDDIDGEAPFCHQTITGQSVIAVIMKIITAILKNFGKLMGCFFSVL